MDAIFAAYSSRRRAWFASQVKFVFWACGLIFLFAHRLPAQTNPLAVSTIAGLANFGTNDGNGPAARFLYPTSVAVDGFGNVYVADSENSTIRKITPEGVVSTLAGTAQVTGSRDGPGATALFNQPYGVAVDTFGNVYVADTYNSTIRLISTNGMVSTFAGIVGSDAYRDGQIVNGNQRIASFGHPFGIALDSSNNVYVADSDLNLIRKISSGIVSTLAGDNNINDITAGTNSGSANGTGTAARFNFPTALATDAAGNVYVADTSNYLVRLITPAGVVTNFAGTGTSGTNGSPGTNTVPVSGLQFGYPTGIAVDSATNVYVVDNSNQLVVQITPSGNVSTMAGQLGGIGDGDGIHESPAVRFKYPWGIAIDFETNLYIGDAGNATVREISFDSMLDDFELSTLAGPDESYGLQDSVTNGAGARLDQPGAVAVDGSGNIYVADTVNNCIRQITPGGSVETIAGDGFAGFRDSTTNAAAEFDGPTGLCIDGATNIYVADFNNSTVRMISPMITNISGTNFTSWVTVTIAGQPLVYGASNAAVGTNATFDGPFGIALDSATNLYVTDNGNKLVRLIAAGTFAVSTYAGTNTNSEFSDPLGIAVDSNTNVYVADDGNNAVFEVSSNGGVANFSTNLANLLNYPWAIAVDTNNNVYVANTGANTIVGVTAGGKTAATIAGTAGSFGSADGLGSAAQFYYPEGLALDASGNLYVADTYNNTIRMGVPIVAGQKEVVSVNTSPSGLGIGVNGTNYGVTPQIFILPTNTAVTAVAALTNEYFITNADLNTVVTNFYLFTNWISNGVVASSATNYTFTPGANVTLIANYVPLYTYSLSASPAIGGIVASSRTNVPSGSAITVTATATNSYRFVDWTVNEIVVSTNPAYAFTLTENESLVANFLPPLYQVSATALPVNEGSVGGSGIYLSNTTATLTAVPVTGFAFTNWTTTNGALVTTANPYNFTVVTNVQLIANFAPYYSIAMAGLPATEGTVVVSNGVTTSSNLTVVSNSILTATATANSGFAFTGWSINGVMVTNANPYTFLLGSNETLVGNFAPYYTLLVTNVPNTEGTVLVSNGVLTNVTLTLVSNSTVSAIATTNPGYAFTGWYTTNGALVATTNPYTFPLLSNQTLVGNFAPYYTLTTVVSGNGTVSPTNSTVVSNTMVSLTATPGANFGLKEFETTNGVLLSTNNPYSFPLLSNEVVEALFYPTYSVTLTNIPYSSGSVGGGGPAILSNSTVNAFAVANRGYVFTDWETTNGTLLTYSSSYQFTVSSNTSLVARFGLTPPQISVSTGGVIITNNQTNQVSFPTVQPGSNGVSMLFTITNLGGQSLNISNIIVSPAANYTLVTNASVTVTNMPHAIVGLAGGTFEVKLNTANVGVFPGTITISNNDPVNSNFVFDVTGTVLPPGPQIVVSAGTNTLVNNQTNIVDFGTVINGQPPPAISFVVSNAGEQPLVLSGITLPSGYLLEPGYTNIVGAGGSTILAVQVNTGVSGGYTGNIRIVSNDTNNGVFTFPVSAELSIIQLSGTLAFGVVPAGSSEKESFSIKNIGSSPLHVTGINYPSGLTGAWSGTIASNGSQLVSVTFTPATAAYYGGTVTVLSDAASGINTMPVTAFGANNDLVLTVLTSGPGTVSPSTDNGKTFKANTKISLKAVPGSTGVFAGWAGSVTSTNNPLTYVMTVDSILQANFVTNPFTQFVGTYNGLFTNQNGIIDEQSAGMLKSLVLSSKGTYSASLLVGGSTKSFTGSFNADLQSSKSLTVAKVSGPVNVTMTLVSNSPGPQVVGTVSNASWSSVLLADRAATTEVSPTYTLLIPPDIQTTAPVGSGYAVITASGGNAKTAASAKLAGALADGTSFTDSASVSSDGYVPVYASLYNNTGALLGWLNLTNSNDSELFWVHPARPAPFATVFVSTNPTPIAPWTQTIGSFTQLQVLDGPGGTNVVTNAVVNVSGGKIKGLNVSGTIVSKTGVVTVTIGSGSSKITAHGILLNNGTNGGYYTTKTGAGAVLLAP